MWSHLSLTCLTTHVKKHTYAGAAAALLAIAIGGSAGAQAQSWTDANGTINFAGCFGSEAGIQCNYTYTLTKLQTGQVNGDFHGYQYYLADGSRGEAASLSIGGENFKPYSAGVTAVSGIPVNVAFVMNLPRTTPNIAALVIFGHRINNVFVSQTGKPAVSAPVAVAARPAAVSVPAPATGGAVTVSLTGCTTSAGVITCTKAVIGPPR